MNNGPGNMSESDWREGLPLLAGRLVTLREPDLDDAGWVVDLLSVADASRFGLPAPVTDASVRALLTRARADRAAGFAFTYAVTLDAGRGNVGLMQIRRLDPAFELAEWEATLAPSARGTRVFIEAARLIGSFVFDVVGCRRLECRVLLQNGRANGALRKLGATQEGVLRRSVRHNGEYLDQAIWSVLKEDWRDHRGAARPRVH